MTKRAPKPRDVKPENIPRFNHAADVLLEAEVELQKATAAQVRAKARDAQAMAQAALRTALKCPEQYLSDDQAFARMMAACWGMN